MGGRVEWWLTHLGVTILLDPKSPPQRILALGRNLVNGKEDLVNRLGPETFPAITFTRPFLSVGRETHTFGAHTRNAAGVDSVPFELWGLFPRCLSSLEAPPSRGTLQNGWVAAFSVQDPAVHQVKRGAWTEP